jgi:hypothetical protein
MKNTTFNTTQTRTGRPRSTHYQAVQIAVKNYHVNPKTGRIYNRNGEQIGGTTYEPRVTVHLEGKKYNARVNKIVGFVVFGPEALRRGVSVIHKNGDKFDNRGTNLRLVYSRAAARAYRRLLAA